MIILPEISKPIVPGPIGQKSFLLLIYQLEGLTGMNFGRESLYLNILKSTTKRKYSNQTKEKQVVVFGF